MSPTLAAGKTRASLLSKIQQSAARAGKNGHGRPATLPPMELPSRRKKTALVIGCGIGGPAAALALERAGLNPILFEAYPSGAEQVGSFLNLSSNGLDALRTIGAHRPVLEAGFPTPRMVMWSHTGRKLGEVANGMPLEDGTRTITIRRGLLHRALRDEAARRGIRILFSKRLVRTRLERGQVIAEFEDGSAAEGDLLVGADGLHSTVRRLVDAGNPSPRYTGQLSIAGIAPGAPHRPEADSYLMIFGRRAFFGCATSPSGETYWFANVDAAEREAALSAPEWSARLLALFEGDAGPARALIGATGDQLGAYPIFDMPRVPTWHRDLTVLLGDAIHATSPSAGQGAAMAIEDAVSLARWLRDAPRIGDAFTAYEAERRRRVEKVVTYSRRVGSTKVAGPIGRVLRDAMMPLALKLYSGSSAHAWLYRHHIDWNAAGAEGSR